MSGKNVTSEEWEYWYSRVYAYFYKRVNGKYEVEELTSQTLTTAFLAENVLNFKAYTWKVAHNYLVKYIQTKNLDPMPVSWDENLDLANATLPKWHIEESFETQTSDNYNSKLNQLLDCIRQNISKPQDCQILELAIYEEKNSTQIAEIVGLNADNVRQKLSRNIKKIRTTCIDLWKHLITK
jgi:RNA polymerase sigma factor (sigma-70 family)